MPRNRQRRPPAEPVEARIEYVRGGQPECVALTRCGHCGQQLMWFECDVETSALRWPSTSMIAYHGDRSFIATNAGWRWDGRVWHPTIGHQQRRQRAREKLVSRAQRGRLREGLFEGRNRRLVSETVLNAVRDVRNRLRVWC
jgi:hypothetical protein